MLSSTISQEYFWDIIYPSSFLVHKRRWLTLTLLKPLHTGLGRRPSIHHIDGLSHSNLHHLIKNTNITERTHIWEAERLLVLYLDVGIWEVFKSDHLKMNPLNLCSVLSNLVRNGQRQFKIISFPMTHPLPWSFLLYIPCLICSFFYKSFCYLHPLIFFFPWGCILN